LSALALAIALAGLFDNGAQPAAATTLVGSIGPQAAMGAGFTYQGYLARNGAPINGAGQCDMRFSLWDAASGGAQIGSLQTLGAVDFANGAFTVMLNDTGQFGANAFSGAARWLQVELACPSGSGTFSTVGRQAITSVPYASYSQSTGALQGRSISAAAPVSGQVLRWDGSAWAPTSTYTRTVLVSPLATPAQSGAALLAALAAIVDASATTPYLLKIEPGVYDLGASTLQMKPYVDIEGSGQAVTILTGQGGPEDGKAVVFGANNTELRQLSVRMSVGDVPYTAAIRNISASPRLTDVIIRVNASTGAANRVYGIHNSSGSAPLMRNVTVFMRGGYQIYGLYNFTDSSPTIISSSFDVGDGYFGQTIYNLTRSSPTILYSTVIGTDSIGWSYGILSEDSSNPRIHSSIINAVPPFNSGNGTTYVANSMVESRGSLSFGLGNRCIGSYNAAFQLLPATCQ
jgi:hypothetical protein